MVIEAVAIAALAVGFYHGLLDHKIVPAVRGGGHHLGAFFALYAVLGLPYLYLWTQRPTLAVFILLLFTAVHWGQEEAYLSARLFLGTPSPAVLVPTAIWRGGVIVVAPTVLYVEEYQWFINTLLSPFGERVVLAPHGWLLAALTGVGCLILVAVTHRYHPTDAAAEALYSVLFAAWFTFITPLLSIPLYFALCHSWIHLSRMEALLGYESFGDTVGDAARLFVLTLPVAALVVIVLPAPTGPLVWYFVLVSILTVPHTVLTGWLDYHTYSNPGVRSRGVDTHGFE